ncbi:MAG: hypothetical protein ACLPZM_03895 [Thermoplasmata archaeon]
MAPPPGSESVWPDTPISETLTGLKHRIVASILVPVAWLSATLLYLAFWAQGFSLFQNIVVALVSVIVLIGVMAGIWVSFGFRQARTWMEW